MINLNVMNPNAKFWKESAALLLLARNSKRHSKADGYDYKALVLKRSAKTSVMPNGIVFPGGQIESCDSSRDWLALYESLGVSLKTLTDLTEVDGERPPIFRNVEGLQREISLRVSCIRETFEELGVLICRDENDLEDTTDCTRFATFKSDFNVKEWQKKVHEDPTQFLELCNKQKVVPDIWGTHEWSAWLTPNFRKGTRFEAAFYLATLNEMPEVHFEPNEVQGYMWETPMELLNLFSKQELWLPPPQHYEISRLAGVSSIDRLSSFAKNRSGRGSILFYPVLVNAKDGQIHLLPGDIEYPVEPNLQTGDGDAVHKLDVSMEDQRPQLGTVHRSEHRKSLYDMELIIESFEPDCGHLCPILDLKATKSNL